MNSNSDEPVVWAFAFCFGNTPGHKFDLLIYPQPREFANLTRDKQWRNRQTSYSVPKMAPTLLLTQPGIEHSVIFNLSKIAF